jgi:uncharacterized protein
MDTQRLKNKFARVAHRATNVTGQHATPASPRPTHSSGSTRGRMPATAYPPPNPAQHDAVPGSPGERALQDALGTRDRAERFSREQVCDLLTPRMQAFIGRMEMAWIATSDRAGRCDCSFRSGPPGFVRILGERELAYPDYRGNGVMASSGNVLENPHIGMWFGDFDQELIGLHVNGRAAVLTPGQMREADLEFAEPGHPGRRPAHWVVVVVEEAYVHCRKHLPRLVRQPLTRHWGTDNPVRKGGDYFGVAASRCAELGDLTGDASDITTATPDPWRRERDEPTGARDGVETWAPND